MPFKDVPPLYNTWVGMRWRCEKPTFKQYVDYGGRGIYVCDRWKDFRAFEADMGPRPSPLHSLDRIDNDGPYSPENCRWATRREQQLNRRLAVFVTIEGQRYRAIELAERFGLKTDTIVSRAAKGMPFSEVTSAERRRNLEGLKLGPEAKKTKARNRQSCRNGHPLDDANTYVTPEGWRRCRACHAAKMRRLNAEKS